MKEIIYFRPRLYIVISNIDTGCSHPGITYYSHDSRATQPLTCPSLHGQFRFYMATISTTALASTVGCNIKSPFTAAAVPAWASGLLCALGHITGFHPLNSISVASPSNASKSISKIKSVLTACVLAFA